METQRVTIEAFRAGRAVLAHVTLHAGLPSQVEVELADGLTASGTGSDLFDALAKVRRDLEKSDVLLACNGARLNVHGSGMLRGASNGRRAYLLAMPRTSGKPEVVDIFEPAPIDSIATVDEQEAWYRSWLESPLSEHT